MLKEDMIRGPSCLTNALPGEPVFLLRANDELSPRVILMWAALYAEQKRVENAKTLAGGFCDMDIQSIKKCGLTVRQRAKWEDSIACAEAMLDWKRRQT